ncbi:MAG: hypothetical protein D6678_07330 [Zetaproteobacteria bacterium]|nr:MAG: hypothetical protein D6678_07330 [Zetaproteobacteria bacterium]
MIRVLFAVGLMLTLSACVGGDEPVPMNTIESLAGTWQQIDGKGRVRFYRDESVKLTMPDEHPPLRVLSVLEVIKDDKVGFSIGDRWQGPVHVRLSKDGDTLTLVFPDEHNPEGKSVRFVRAKTN